MPLAFVFWLLMLLWLIFGLWHAWPFTSPFVPVGNLMLFIIIAILGWQVFGNPIR